MGFFSDNRKPVLTEGTTRAGSGYQPEDKPEFSAKTPMPPRQPPRPRPPAPPKPETAYPMSNAELAEAIEYTRSAIGKVSDSQIQTRLKRHMIELLDVQAARAKAVKLDSSAGTVP